MPNDASHPVNGWRGIAEAYRTWLPLTSATPLVTLYEGDTPLLESRSLSRRVGRDVRVLLKCEGFNPTGSFKDRGMTIAVSKALEQGSRSVVCASTGNTSASASAYAARAGLRSIVLIPKGAIALGKLAQALMHGASVLSVTGNFDICLQLVRELSERYPMTLVNSLNPYRIEGQKTAAFEICDALGEAPDYHAMPVGNAGNITAYWRGYREYHRHKRIARLPIMLGFQAAGAAPLVRGKVVTRPQTIASAIRIGNPASWKSAIAAKEESHGTIEAVTDAMILTAYRLLAQEEGVFVEPASAAAVAGVLKLAARRYFAAGSTVVCVLTGHGLKDPDRAITSVRMPSVVPASVAAIVRKIGKL